MSYCSLCDDKDPSCICSLDDRKQTMTEEEYRKITDEELKQLANRWWK